MRYRPKIEWSKNSWTHNVFRFFELLFGRKYGIRREMTAEASFNKGKVTVTYTCHTFEAFCSLIEQYIRGLIPRKLPVRLYIPQLATTSPLQPTPFLFAIAFDNSGEGSGSGVTNFSFNFTTSGSDRGMVGNTVAHSTSNFTSITYNSVAMSTAGSAVSGGTLTLVATYLNAPSTGSNSVVTTWDASDTMVTIVASYTGVFQTGQPSATSSSASIASQSSPFTRSITLVDNNSWAVEAFLVAASASSSTNATIRTQETAIYGAGIADSNGPKAAGNLSQSLTFTGSANCGAVQLALSPVSLSSGATLLLMGV